MKKWLWVIICIGFSFDIDNPICVDKIYNPVTTELSSPVRSKISVTGSFGELRNNHFHAGIDIRSMTGVGGDDILSAADGFVSRIEISEGDYGKNMYIQHPSGHTTMYAHLDHFRADIEARVKTEQYKQQSFAIDLSFDPGEFPVIAGDQVAYMGNTGASKGAHLHFELRNTGTNEVLNPIDYGLPVEDYLSPIVRRIKIYGFNPEGISESEHVFPQSKLKNNYTVISVPGDMVGIGVDALDRINNSWNWLGIRSIKLFVDGGLMYYFDTDKWNIDDTKFINAHIDYPSKISARGSFHRCFLLSGNKMPLYKIIQNDGLFYLNEGTEHRVQVLVGDAHNNVTEISFGVKKIPYTAKIKNNIEGQEFINNVQSKTITSDNYQFQFEPGTFYENFNFEIKSDKNNNGNAYSEWIGINPSNAPIHKYFNISIKANKEIPQHLISKCFIALRRSSSYVSLGGNHDGNQVNSKSKQLGSFAIMVDTIAPRITPIKYRANLRNERWISFRIQDNIPALGEARGLRYNAYIDGQWILMEHDAKSHIIKHHFEDWLSDGKHELSIEVTDDRDNKREYKSSFYK